MGRSKMTLARRIAFGWLPLTLSAIGCGWSACSSSSDKQDLPFERSEQTSSVVSVWDEEFPGPITELAIARRTGDLVAATIPDAEAGGKHLLTLIARDGKRVFQIQSPFPVKSLDIASDGSRVVVNNHEGKLISYDRAGQGQWQSEGACRPIILNASKRILCFHDDDTRPSFAFDLYDFDGKRIFRLPARADVLNLKVSDDERWLAIGLAGGKALVYSLPQPSAEAAPAASPSGTPVVAEPSPKPEPKLGMPKLEREWKVTGEILDLSVSNGDEPKLGVIALDVKKGETLSFLDVKKGANSSIRLSYHVEQIELFPSGRLAAVYGNSPRGQYLAVHSTTDSTLQWQRLEERYADYSLAARVGADRVIAGFERQSGTGSVKTRTSHVAVLDLDGKMKADIPLKTAEGAYLYSFAYSPEASLLGVGTDDRRLRLFELK
jgi:hypothetical protein